jgi:hypothetical protein
MLCIGIWSRICLKASLSSRAQLVERYNPTLPAGHRLRMPHEALAVAAELAPEGHDVPWSPASHVRRLPRRLQAGCRCAGAGQAARAHPGGWEWGCSSRGRRGPPRQLAAAPELLLLAGLPEPAPG